MVSPKRIALISKNGVTKRPPPRIGKSNSEMKVYIRIRPYTTKERTAEFRNIVKVIDKHRLEFDPKESGQPFFFHGVKQKMRDINKKQNKEMKFVFDRIYGEECTNDDVYNESIKNLLPSLLEGYNCSVFVYGATGAGKTYTMIGNNTSPGITYLTMLELYAKMEELKETKNFELVISYLEVYNENVHDLLNPGCGPLQLREDPVNGVVVANMKLENVSSAEHLLDVLQRGNGNRTQHPTDANAESSRSHAVFQVFLRIQDKGSEQVKVVKLTMIDLAGSERGAATNYGGIRFKEGSNINRSLLALGNCINKLADGVKHIPYRDSKLTRLLKDSLGGNCQTIMIACVAPTVRAYEDTYNTLKYANRAKNIKMALSKNLVALDTHDQYKQLIQELQNKITAVEGENSRYVSKLEEYGKTIEEQRCLLRVCDQQWKDKYNVLYEEKKHLHQKLLTLESNGKILELKAKQKAVVVKRISAFNNDDTEKDVEKLTNAIQQLEGRILGTRNKMSEMWDKKIENDQKLEQLITEMRERGVYDNMTEYIENREMQIREMEAILQYEHTNKVNTFMHLQIEAMDEMIMELVDENKQYHLLLCGYNKMTNTMMNKHRELQSMLKNCMKVSWAISPNAHMKRKIDFCSLSLDNLKQCKKPCLPVIEDSAIAMPVDMNDDEGDEATFIIDDPTSKFSKIRSSPKSKSKPTTPKRIDKKLTPREKSKQVSGLKRPHSGKTPKIGQFKMPRRPFMEKENM